VALSNLKHGFESRRERQQNQAFIDVGASECPINVSIWMRVATTVGECQTKVSNVSDTDLDHVDLFQDVLKFN
jgi:hypothetical protein